MEFMFSILYDYWLHGFHVIIGTLFICMLSSVSSITFTRDHHLDLNSQYVLAFCGCGSVICYTFVYWWEEKLMIM
jgi:hypothetical protein